MSVLNVQEKVKEMLLPKCGGTHVHVCGCFVGKTLYGYWPIQSNRILGRLPSRSSGETRPMPGPERTAPPAQRSLEIQAPNCIPLENEYYIIPM